MQFIAACTDTLTVCSCALRMDLHKYTMHMCISRKKNSIELLYTYIYLVLLRETTENQMCTANNSFNEFLI